MSLAEFYLLKEDKDNAKKYANKAKDLFNKDNKREILRANDIIEFAKNLKD